MSGARLIVFGSTGQLGRALTCAELPPGCTLTSISRAEADLSAPDTLAAALDRHAAGSTKVVVIVAAAYTGVDNAEKDADGAYAVNCLGPASIAKACAERGYPIITLSTDYVFDGRRDQPYVETDAVGPINVYGRTKLQGELAVQRETPQHVILRTSWVFSGHGANFVRTMLRLARDRPQLGIVDDQRGSPTHARDLAETVVAMAQQIGSGKQDGFGLFHYCGKGTCTWFEFAQQIFALAKLDRTPELHPIATSQYPTPARRPANSALACGKISAVYGIEQRPWQDGLAACLGELIRADLECEAGR